MSPFLDAEVLQEVLHRYTAIEKRSAIGPAFQVILEIVDDVQADMLRAAEIAQSRTRLSARDAVHIAIMERHGIKSAVSFDADFDRWPGLKRIHRV